MAVELCTIHELQRADHPGAVVVIDVIRAFTTAAAAVDAGVDEIHCVEGLDEARALRAAIPGSLLMGEERGHRPDGFDFGNSPIDLMGLDLTGRVMVQRTSNGTRGLAWTASPLVLAGAAVNASATARLAATMAPVALVCTGASTTEDRVCAEHIKRLVEGQPVDDADTRSKILDTADEHIAFWTRERTAADLAAHHADVAACAEVDRYDFAMVAERRGKVVTLTRHDDRQVEPVPASVGLAIKGGGSG